MASWTTPITDWDGVTVNRIYYNYGDWDRVEQNTEYIKDEFEAIGYGSDTTTFTYPRTVASWNQYKSDLNRIEKNILALKDATFEPTTWIDPQTDWKSMQQSFAYEDANRIEKDLLYLYEMLQNIKSSLEFYKIGNPRLVCGGGYPVF